MYRCNMNRTLGQYAQALEERVAQSTLRHLRSSKTLANGMLEISGRPLLNLASNDYLGLSQHPALIARAQEYTQKYGVGSGASRLISGNLSIFDELEMKLAALKGTEAALILPSGFQANNSVLPSILHKGCLAAVDRLVHRSIADGLLLSSARWTRYEHNNLHEMQTRLQALSQQSNQNAAARWVVTESVFSMDGDKCDLPALIAMSESSDSFALYVDEAHATGVLGRDGMGLTAGLSFSGISMGTFGKGLGSFGSYLACSAMMREYLINFCPGLIYSTALPPPVLGAIDAALDLIPQMETERNSLQENAEQLRVSLKQMGFETGNSSTHIIPIILGSTISSLSLSSYLEEEGIFLPAIRPPTIPEGSARLRVSLSSVHSKEQIAQFLKVLRRWHEKKN